MCICTPPQSRWSATHPEGLSVKKRALRTMELELFSNGNYHTTISNLWKSVFKSPQIKYYKGDRIFNDGAVEIIHPKYNFWGSSNFSSSHDRHRSANADPCLRHYCPHKQ